MHYTVETICNMKSLNSLEGYMFSKVATSNCAEFKTVLELHFSKCVEKSTHIMLLLLELCGKKWRFFYKITLLEDLKYYYFNKKKIINLNTPLVMYRSVNFDRFILKIILTRYFYKINFNKKINLRMIIMFTIYGDECECTRCYCRSWTRWACVSLFSYQNSSSC